MKTIVTETISNVIAMSLNYDAECIDNMCINFETTISENDVKSLFLKAAAAGNLQDFGNSIKTALLQSVINKNDYPLSYHQNFGVAALRSAGKLVPLCRHL